jgi:hypothetical protein
MATSLQKRARATLDQCCASSAIQPFGLNQHWQPRYHLACAN